MAIYGAYCLYDMKALQYAPPFFSVSDAVAKRMVSDLVADLNTTVGRHPSDFKLFKIALYDDLTAIFDSFPVLQHIVDCVVLVPPAPALTLPFDIRTSEPTVYKTSAQETV